MFGTTKILAACLVILGLAACQEGTDKLLTGPRQPLMSGESGAFNSSVHTIDPAPEAAKNTDIAIDGNHAVAAHERYTKGEVIAPEEVITSDVGNN